ncbi:MAG TPA: pyridoxal-dependent decarboxylase [Xanthomonadaceae bacterium]|nr:pyridoxal-dependent decarboxylase [Xanthomonadaceae bacterium]
MHESDHDFLAPLFLGASGDNEALAERLLLDAFRDNVYWRRNFHPEDAPTVSAMDRQKPSYIAIAAHMEQLLRRLGADLKRSTPLFSPRYVGHMASDLLLPGLLAQLMTTLYNPNNVSADAAPVTLELEIEVGRQLATMLGMDADPQRGDGAYGHLCSGGTSANYEALWLLRAARMYAPAAAALLRAMPQLAAPGTQLAELAGMDGWILHNLLVGEALNLAESIDAAVAGLPTAGERRQAAKLLREARLEHLGQAGFQSLHGQTTPVVIVPGTAHYSWTKAVELLGLGTAQLWRAPVDGHMRMRADGVEALLERALAERVPVLAVVGVLGTTEFGTIDPIHELVALRDRFAARGLAFALHIDAAWGGYLTSLLRAPCGGTHPHRILANRFRYFPSEGVFNAFAAVAHADTVTVDPHKLGFLPYGAGALVGRDRRLTHLVGTRPAYLFDGEGGDRLHQLGDYILEGSKPGAAAAAAWVTHRMLPLDSANFGRLLATTIDSSEHLFDRLAALDRRLAGECRVLMPVEPDTNLCCIALNPVGNTSLEQMNAFGRAVFSRLAVNPDEPVQTRQFLGSFTSLKRAHLDDADAVRLAEFLGVDPAGFSEDGTDHLFLLRHTLMNPWLTVEHEGRNYLDRYCDYLEAAIRAELPRWQAARPAPEPGRRAA